MPKEVAVYESFADALLLLAGVLWGIELIPQLIKTIKLKDVSGISLLFCLLCFIAYVVYMVGAYMKGFWMVIIAHTPSMVLWGVMLILVLKYRKNTPVKDEQDVDAGSIK